jgi:Flp pilus assembly protein TadD
MNTNSPLDTILFITVPEDFHHHLEGVDIDPAIPLPVQPGVDPEEWNIESLTWEMIVSGMLTVLAVEPDHEHSDYFRQFVLAARPDIFTELSETGIIAGRNENYAVAADIFSALWGLAPDRPEGPANLAIIYEQRGDNLERVGREDDAEMYRHKAKELYGDLLTREDISPDVRLNAGMFFIKVQNYDSAETQLSYFLAESDDEEKKEHARRILNEIRTHNLADELFKEAYDFIKVGDEERGIERIREFLVKNPTVWNGWFLLGWGLRRLGRFDDAEAAFRKALDSGGENPDTLNELAICEMELGSYDESRRHLEQAITLEPENTKIMSNLGVLEMKRNDPLEARRYFQTVLEFEPDDPVARKYLELLNETYE